MDPGKPEHTAAFFLHMHMEEKKMFFFSIKLCYKQMLYPVDKYNKMHSHIGEIWSREQPRSNKEVRMNQWKHHFLEKINF